MRPSNGYPASTRPDAELRWLTTLSRALPRHRPSRWLARRLRKVYLRRSRSEVCAEVAGARMRLRPGDYVEGQLLFAPQFYEAEERAWVQQHLRPGDVFADLGAHAGLYTLLAARAVGPAGCVIAVEANPETFARLQENLRENGFEQVRAFDCGVSDRAEVRKLGHTGAANTGAASFLAEGGGEEEVECLPLLTILERAAVQRLDGLKLDIEGFEHRVLERFFADVPVSLYPDFVLLEHKQRLIARAGGDALALLQRHGYRAVLEAKGRRDWSNFGLVHEKAMRCGLGEEREP